MTSCRHTSCTRQPQLIRGQDDQSKVTRLNSTTHTYWVDNSMQRGSLKETHTNLLRFFVGHPDLLWRWWGHLPAELWECLTVHRRYRPSSLVEVLLLPTRDVAHSFHHPHPPLPTCEGVGWEIKPVPYTGNFRGWTLDHEYFNHE